MRIGFCPSLGAAHDVASATISLPRAICNGSMRNDSPPDAENARTWRLVAAEQLPDTIARDPDACGSSLAAFEGAIPKLAGNPMATPDPAVTSGMPLSAGPSLIKSSFEIASTIAI